MAMIRKQHTRYQRIASNSKDLLTTKVYRPLELVTPVRIWPRLPSICGVSLFYKYLFYLPTEVANDSQFPFTPGDLVTITVNAKKQAVYALYRSPLVFFSGEFHDRGIIARPFLGYCAGKVKYIHKSVYNDGYRNQVAEDWE